MSGVRRAVHHHQFARPFGAFPTVEAAACVPSVLVGRDDPDCRELGQLGSQPCRMDRLRRFGRRLARLIEFEAMNGRRAVVLKKAFDPILVAFISFVALGLTSGLLGLAWPSMQKRFGLPIDAVGALYVASTAAYLVVSVAIGRIMARLGSGTTLLLGALLLMLAMFGTAAAPAWGVVVAFSAIGGLGSGVVDAGLNLHVATHHTARQMNWLHASFGIGVTAGPLVMTFALQRGPGWRFGYVVAGVFMLVPAALIFVTRRRWYGEAAAEKAPDIAAARASFGRSFRVASVWLGVATFIACVGLEIAVGQWAFVLLTESRGVAEGPAGVCVSAHWAALTGGRVLFGFISERIGTYRLLGVLMPSLAVATAMLWWNPTPAVGIAALLAIGFVEAPIFPLLMAGTRRRVGPAHAENAVALQMFGSGIASALLPGLIGTIGRRFGLEAMPPAFTALAVVALVCHMTTQIQSRDLAER